MALLVEYREYTTKGRFVSDAIFESHKDFVLEDISNLIESNEKSVRNAVSDIYKYQGLMKPTEVLKPLFKTNIVVRDTKTGRFQKWSNFLPTA